MRTKMYYSIIRWIIMLIFPCLVVGCVKSGEYSFDVQEDKKHELISVDTPLFQPAKLIFLKDAMLILDEKTDYLLHVFSRSGSEWLGSYIRRGHGPGEETEVWEIRAIDNNRFLYVTGSQVKIMEFDVTTNSVVELESIAPAEKLKEVFKLGGNLFGYPAFFGEQSEYLGYDPQQKVYFPFGAGFLPQLKGLNHEEQGYLSSKWITVRPDHQHFAAVHQWFPVLRIYNSTDGNLIKEVVLKTGQAFPAALLDENLSMEQTKELTWENYVGIQSTQSFIYGLFLGKPLAEIYPPNVRFRSDLPAEIHVWDWEGNPVRRIIPDHKIIGFDVTADDKYLLAISLEMEDHLLRFEL